MNTQSTQNNERELILLPRGEEAILSDGVFRTTARFDDSVGMNHYIIKFSIQFKPLAFLGRYLSTFDIRGVYSENSLGQMGWDVREKAPHYLKLRPNPCNV